MSCPLSGELVFKVTFDQHGFPIGSYTRAAIIHTCAAQIYARAPFNESNKPADGDYQDVSFIDPELYHNPEIIKTMMFYNKLL